VITLIVLPFFTLCKAVSKVGVNNAHAPPHTHTRTHAHTHTQRLRPRTLHRVVGKREKGFAGAVDIVHALERQRKGQDRLLGLLVFGLFADPCRCHIVFYF
jgi:hypothetical protein